MKMSSLPPCSHSPYHPEMQKTVVEGLVISGAPEGARVNVMWTPGAGKRQLTSGRRERDKKSVACRQEAIWQTAGGRRREENDHFHLGFISVSCSGDSLSRPIHLPLWVIDSQCYMSVRSAGLPAGASFMGERQIYRQKDKQHASRQHLIALVIFLENSNL